MGRYHTIIYGKDLAAYMQIFNPELAPKIDRKGVNIVVFSMLHNDQDMRAMMMIKLVNDPKPFEALIDFPFPVWKQITQQLWDEGTHEASH